VVLTKAATTECATTELQQSTISRKMSDGNANVTAMSGGTPATNEGRAISPLACSGGGGPAG